MKISLIRGIACNVMKIRGCILLYCRIKYWGYKIRILYKEVTSMMNSWIVLEALKNLYHFHSHHHPPIMFLDSIRERPPQEGKGNPSRHLALIKLHHLLALRRINCSQPHISNKERFQRFPSRCLMHLHFRTIFILTWLIGLLATFSQWD